MLVLSRRKDETIKIGDDIAITVVEIKGDSVRLGITAPKSISVHRKEIYDAIQAENKAVAQRQAPTTKAIGQLAAMLKPKEEAGLATLLKTKPDAGGS